MNAFEVCGAILALWAVLVAALGITREGFPGDAEKLVAFISVVLVALAIGSAIYTGATEKEGDTSGKRLPSSSLYYLPA